MTTEHAADRLLDVMDATQPGRDLADALRETLRGKPIPGDREFLRAALARYDEATGREDS